MTVKPSEPRVFRSYEEMERNKRTNPHCRDAVVCAMSARAHDKGLTYPASERQPPLSEGWIELPKPDSLAQLVGG